VLLYYVREFMSQYEITRQRHSGAQPDMIVVSERIRVQLRGLCTRVCAAVHTHTTEVAPKARLEERS
jgi:hypothetical protein